MIATKWRIGGGGVPRTYETALTDSEVVLCDVLFRNRTPLQLIQFSEFGAMFNLGYQLGLAPDEVSEAVTAMSDRGLVAESHRKGERLLTLTALGGSLWELERAPVWDAYCCDSRWPVGDELVLRVGGERREVVDAFLTAGTECRMFSPAESVEWMESADDGLHWRPGRMVTASVRLQRGPSRPDWDRYESRRTWWRTVPELLRSHGAMPSPSGWPSPPPLFDAGDV